MEPLEHSVPDLALLWTIDLFPERTAPDPLFRAFGSVREGG